MRCIVSRCSGSKHGGDVYVVDGDISDETVEVEMVVCEEHIDDVAAAFDGGVDSENVEVYR